MTFETTFNVPAQLIMNGEVIDVMVQSVSTRDEETTIVHEEKFKVSNGKLFIEPHIIGRNIQTVTTFECMKIENKRVF